MEANPEIVIEGMEKLIERDLEKHNNICDIARKELASFRAATSHEVRKKRHYRSLINGGKFNDKALKKSIDMINVNIRHFQDRSEATEEKLKFNTHIVDTLTEQLKEQNEKLKALYKSKK